MPASSITTNQEVDAAIRLFEAWIESQRAYRELPGLSVGIVYDQELIWSRGFGVSDTERSVPATPQTVYRIASITKLFTSTALMQLRDKGLLRLDDPIVKYLPWFAVRSREENTPPITIRNLLTHTSGLPREAGFPYWSDGVFPTREQIMQALPEQESVYPPYTRWKYSNLALTLAGEIVQAVAGQAYADYIKGYILDPLEMTSTSVVCDSHHERLATGYTRRIPGVPRQISPYTDCVGITPAANMASTVEDLARFASLQFTDGPAGGSRILAGSTLREMQRVHWLAPDWTTGWGLGFAIQRIDERTLIGHAGSLAGYRTKLSISPDEKIAVIVLTNADDGNPDHYVNQAWTTAASAITKAATPPSPTPVLDGLERYEGLYRSLWGDTRAIVQTTGLVLFSPESENLQEGILKLTPEGEHTFRAVDGSPYSAIGELVVFEMGKNGEVTRLKIGENYSYPVRS